MKEKAERQKELLKLMLKVRTSYANSDPSKIIEEAKRRVEEERKREEERIAAEKARKEEEEEERKRRRAKAKEREKAKKQSLTPEEKEALKEKRLQKLVGVVVVKCLSKYRDHFDHDAFKKRAKEVRSTSSFLQL